MTEHQYTPDGKAAADKAVAFINCLTHTKGRWAGKLFDLRDWQENEIIRPLFGTLQDDGWRQYRTCYVMLPRKNGKLLCDNTPVPTPDGWTRHGDLRPGDALFDENGNWQYVIAVTERHVVGPCYRVTFSDGESIVAHGNHEWLTETHKPEGRYKKTGEKPSSIKTTQCIAETLTYSARHDLNHSVPVCGGLSMPEAALPIDPYVLGAWLGDGNSNGPRMTCSEADWGVMRNIQAAGEVLGVVGGPSASKRSVGIGVGENNGREKLVRRLRTLGVLNNKHIPPEYLRSSESQRLSLMQGLMDTDGYCSRAGQCEFVTIRPQLRDGFLELARSLGYKPTLTTTRAMLYGKDCGPSFRIQLWAFRDNPIFRLERKAARLKQRPARRTRSATRQISSVEPVPAVPMRCIQVSGKSGLYLAGNGMIPTHNSELAAAIALYCLMADNEYGAEVYSAAADRDQAALVYAVAASMVRNDPLLSSHCEVLDSQKRIVYKRKNSFYKAISSESATKHGYNASCVIYDEVHAAPNRELWQVLQTSQGARDQPMLFAITTAGYDPHSLERELFNYAERVRDGIIEDKTFLPVLYAAPDDADWTEESVWHACNPALGDFRKIDEMRVRCKEAQEIPGRENDFRRLYLCQHTEQHSRWLRMETWDACGTTMVDPEDLIGKECHGGLDLSTTTDITALVLYFPDGGEVLPFFWVPEEGARRRSHMDHVPYEQWVRDGLVMTCPGDTIDYDQIRAFINELYTKYFIRSLARDRWNATQITTQLLGDGIPMVGFGQGYASMTAPTKELERLVLDGGLQHGGNPVLRWMASNVAVETDPAGNLKPSKKVSTERIDGIVALIMALGCAGEEPSGYAQVMAI